MITHSYTPVVKKGHISKQNFLFNQNKANKKAKQSDEQIQTWDFFLKYFIKPKGIFSNVPVFSFSILGCQSELRFMP